MDPITATIMTLIGTGVTMAGKYQAGQAAAAGYKSEADTATKLAAAEGTAADVTEYAGFRAAEGTGLQYRAAAGRQAVTSAAGNVAGRSVADVGTSITSLAQLAERETLGKYQETGYQERLGAAEKTAAAGRYTVAAEQAPIAAAFDVAGTGFAGLGRAGSEYMQLTKLGSVAGTGSQSVSSKWYS